MATNQKNDFKLLSDEPILESDRTDHLEFVVGGTCPDCDGSGRYVGLNTVEVCGACGGTGRVKQSKV